MLVSDRIPELQASRDKVKQQLQRNEELLEQGAGDSKRERELLLHIGICLRLHIRSLTRQLDALSMIRATLEDEPILESQEAEQAQSELKQHENKIEQIEKSYEDSRTSPIEVTEKSYGDSRPAQSEVTERLFLLLDLIQAHHEAHAVRKRLALLPLDIGGSLFSREPCSGAWPRSHSEVINMPMNQMPDYCQTSSSKSSLKYLPSKVTRCPPGEGLQGRCKRRQLEADRKHASYPEPPDVCTGEASSKAIGVVIHLQQQAFTSVNTLHRDNPTHPIWAAGSTTQSSKSSRLSKDDVQEELLDDVGGPTSRQPILRGTRKFPDFNGYVTRVPYNLYQDAMSKVAHAHSSNMPSSDVAARHMFGGLLRPSKEVFQAARTLKEVASLDAKPQQAVAVDAGPHVAAPAPWGRAAAAGLPSGTGTSSAGSLTPMPQPHTAVDAAADLRAAAAEAGSAATMVEQDMQPAMAARPPSGSKRHAAQADKVVFADGEVKPAQVFAAMLDMSLEAFEAAVAEQNTAAFDFVGGFTAALKSWEENGMDDDDTPLIVRVVQQGFGYSVVSGTRFVIWSCVSVSFAGERVAADEVQVTGPIFDQACGPESLTLPAILDLIAFEATLRPHREQQYVGWQHPDDAGQHGGSGHGPSSSGGGPSGPSYGGGGGSPGKNPRPLNAWQKQHRANGSDQQQADAPEQVSAWVHYPNLQLGQQLSRGRYAEVRLGVYYGQSAVIKLMSVEGWQPRSSYTWEGHVYKKCSNCQSIGAISILLGEGLTFAGQLYFIALTPAPGKPLSALSKQELAAAEGAAVQALQALHADGVLHGDLHADNIMIDLQAGKPPRVTLLDLGHSVLSHNKQAQDRELRHLRALISGT